MHRSYRRNDPWGLTGTRLGFALGWQMLAGGLLLVAFMFEELTREDLTRVLFPLVFWVALMTTSLLALAPGIGSFVVLTLRGQLCRASIATNALMLLIYALLFVEFVSRCSNLPLHMRGGWGTF